MVFVRKRERATKDIKEAREIHAEWAEWVEQEPEEAAEPVAQVETVGDAKFHREWVRRYDRVLEVLQS